MPHDLLEYLFKGVISFGVASVIFILKDFKVCLNKLSESLAAVTLSITSLAVKDEYKAEKLVEIKVEMDRIQSDVSKLKEGMMEIRIRQKNE